jgi:hypothetical protein
MSILQTVSAMSIASGMLVLSVSYHDITRQVAFRWYNEKNRALSQAGARGIEREMESRLPMFTTGSHTGGWIRLVFWLLASDL